MRAVFGVVSLLVVLVVVGVLTTKQLKATSRTLSSAAVQVAPGASSAVAGTVREQSQQLQNQVVNDVTKAMEQGARKDEGDK